MLVYHRNRRLEYQDRDAASMNRLVDQTCPTPMVAKAAVRNIRGAYNAMRPWLDGGFDLVVYYCLLTNVAEHRVVERIVLSASQRFTPGCVAPQILLTVNMISKKISMTLSF